VGELSGANRCRVAHSGRWSLTVYLSTPNSGTVASNTIRLPFISPASSTRPDLSTSMLLILTRSDERKVARGTTLLPPAASSHILTWRRVAARVSEQGFGQSERVAEVAGLPHVSG
jgi:hypothetical protein